MQKLVKLPATQCLNLVAISTEFDIFYLKGTTGSNKENIPTSHPITFT